MKYLFLMHLSAMENKNCNDDHIVVSGVIAGCPYDNLPCHTKMMNRK